MFLHMLIHFFHQKSEENFNIPYFVLVSIREMSENVQKGKKDALAPHGLIKIIVCEALQNLNVKVSWEQCVDMERWVFLESQNSIRESGL
jgi:hypothetical protein